MNTPTLPKLNIIGAGRLGKTLARLWHDSGSVTIGEICNSSLASAKQATHFIGAGTAQSDIAAMSPADIWLIATPDSLIADTCIQLIAQQPQLTHTTNTTTGIVFHASGALDSNQLSPAKGKGLHIASAHPLHSFASPENSLTIFAGTYCALQGDSAATKTLSHLFATIDAQIVTLKPGRKSLYHAAAAMASNYLVTLLNSSEQLMIQAGVPAVQARQMLAPIIQQTAENFCRDGAVKALTGPIARGDNSTIDQHLSAISSQTPELLSLYQLLGKHTVDIAQQQGNASPEQLSLFQQQFCEVTPYVSSSSDTE